MHEVVVDGIRLNCVAWHASRRGHAPTLLMNHATGFHARVWDRSIALLPEFHVVAFDQRGHGRSEATPIGHWTRFGHDAQAVVSALDLRDVIGVGHSMGAHALVLAAAADPSRYRGLVLFDPTILAPGAYRPIVPIDPSSHPVARRTARFESAQAMRERFSQRAPYASFDPDVLRDYCEHGLRPNEDASGWQLACAPATEASVYLAAQMETGVHAAMAALPMPVLVVRSKLPTPQRDPYDYSFSPTWPLLASAFPSARDLHLADRNHLMPMESPALVARLIREYCDQLTG